MAWNSSLDVAVGDATKETDYDDLVENVEYLQALADVEHDFDVSTGTGKHTTVTHDAGAEGTPSVTRDGDLDTGMWFPSANSVAWSTGGSEVMRLDDSQRLMVGTTSTSAKVDVRRSSTSAIVFNLQNTNSSIATTVGSIQSARSANSAWAILYGYSGNGGDLEFNLRGDGQAYADGAWNGSGADYQEFLESTTGTALTVGASVVLDGNKVREFDAIVDDAEDIIGVVRPKGDNKNSAVVGNTAWNHWTDKYLTDEWGVYEREEIAVWSWTDGEDDISVYERDMPEGWTPPEGATEGTESVRKLNPSYDPSADYTPRESRDEWNLIGMLGQIQVLSGQSVHPRWIKMCDVSDSVEMWFVR